jgi:GNAT superfamily N-acetyltransferase
MTEINGQKIELREPVPGDINFLLSTMLKGLYYGSKFWALVDQEAFFKNYEPFLKNLLIFNYVKIACLQEDPDVILGYSLYKNNILHFIFVKKSYRKLGIGKLLYPEGIDTVSHLTDSGDNIRKKLNLKFNPFALGGQDV